MSETETSRHAEWRSRKALISTGFFVSRSLAQFRLEACGDRRPRTQREGDHGLDVRVFETADDGGHAT